MRLGCEVRVGWEVIVDVIHLTMAYTWVMGVVRCIVNEYGGLFSGGCY